MPFEKQALRKMRKLKKITTKATITFIQIRFLYCCMDSTPLRLCNQKLKKNNLNCKETIYTILLIKLWRFINRKCHKLSTTRASTSTMSTKATWNLFHLSWTKRKRRSDPISRTRSYGFAVCDPLVFRCLYTTMSDLNS